MEALFTKKWYIFSDNIDRKKVLFWQIILIYDLESYKGSSKPYRSNDR